MYMSPIFNVQLFSPDYSDTSKLYKTFIASKNDANRGAFDQTSKMELFA